MTDDRPCPPPCSTCPMIDRPLTPELIAAMRREAAVDTTVWRVSRHLDEARWTSSIELAERMGVSLIAARAAVSEARSRGAAIETRQRYGYRLVARTERAA